jgi:quercetin dioxygenase-like cupin family protein
MIPVTAAVAAAALATALTWAAAPKSRVVAMTPDQLKWFVPPEYKDGRQRARLLGDSSRGGAWVDRVKIPAGARVPAHTHPEDELVTVIEGTWYLGEGNRFDAGRLKGFAAGSFIVIPAGVAHFVATKDDPVIIQLSGNDRFRSDYLEK